MRRVGSDRYHRYARDEFWPQALGDHLHLRRHHLAGAFTRSMDKTDQHRPALKRCQRNSFPILVDQTHSGQVVDFFTFPRGSVVAAPFSFAPRRTPAWDRNQERDRDRHDDRNRNARHILPRVFFLRPRTHRSFPLTLNFRLARVIVNAIAEWHFSATRPSYL